MYNVSEKNTSQSNSFYYVPAILPSQAAGIAFCVAFFCVLIFIVVGNGTTIVLFAFNKTQRKKTLLLVVNLAIADFMLGAVSLPLFITYFVGNYYQLWLVQFRNLRVVFFYIFVDLALSQASFLAVIFVSCERFYAVNFPFKHRTLSSRAYWLVILTVWILAFLIAAIGTLLSYFVSFRATVTFWVCVALTQILIVCVCTIGTWRKSHEKNVASQQQNRAAKNKRLTKTLLFVSFVELLTWLPLITLDCLTLSGVGQAYFDYRTFQFIVNVLNFSGSFVNPIVYVLRIPEIRQALSLCFNRRENVSSRKRTETTSSEMSVSTPVKEFGILPSYPSRLQVASQVFDTRF